MHSCMDDDDGRIGNKDDEELDISWIGSEVFAKSGSSKISAPPIRRLRLVTFIALML